jgi:Zn-dependent protease with chaperone function
MAAKKADEFLDGVCRKYLASDGALAHGTLALAPLVTALGHAGAQSVRLELNDFGRPLAAAPQGWTARPHAPKTPFGRLKSVSYLFYSNSDNDLPQPFEVRLGTAWSPARLGIPFGFSLLGPALLAFWLRRRAERKGAVESASVWVHWILTGTWLYWISAVSVTDIAAFAVHLQLDSMVLTFLVGSLVFCVPPLIATASCIAILTRMPAESEERQDTSGLVRRSVAREATLLVPFGMFLVGTGMFEQDWQISIASWPAAYFTYRILSWYVGRGSANRVEILTRGPLMEIAHVIARRAGVALGGIYIINNRSRQEVNAFAGSGRILAMTRGLVEHLTCRELVAVIGHEVAHMRAKHVGIRIAAFWGYMLVVGPLAARSAHPAAGVYSGHRISLAQPRVHRRLSSRRADPGRRGYDRSPGAPAENDADACGLGRHAGLHSFASLHAGSRAGPGAAIQRARGPGAGDFARPRSALRRYRAGGPALHAAGRMYRARSSVHFLGQSRQQYVDPLGRQAGAGVDRAGCR